MDQPRLYNELAYLWPIISPPGEYAGEAAEWRRIIKGKLGPARHSILELGVGGGHILSHLTQAFQATAVDISTPMLELSRRLNPDVTHHQGDMRTVRMGILFDAVLIHDAIGHMLTEADLKAAMVTAKAHLRPGGILLIAPEWLREEFAGPTLFIWTRGNQDIKVTIQEYLYYPDHDDSQIESIYSYMIEEQGKVSIERDVHVNGLFSGSMWSELFEQVGFSLERVSLPGNEGGYGANMFIGTLPTD